MSPEQNRGPLIRIDVRLSVPRRVAWLVAAGLALGSLHLPEWLLDRVFLLLR